MPARKLESQNKFLSHSQERKPSMRWFYRMLQLWFEAVLGRILSRNRGLPLRVSPAATGKEILIAAVLALTLMGCGQPVSHIDWVDFIQFGQVQYLAVDYGGWTGGRPLTDRDLGPEFAKVRNKLAGNVRNPGYRPQDGRVCGRPRAAPGNGPHPAIAARRAPVPRSPAPPGHEPGRLTKVCIFSARTWMTVCVCTSTTASSLTSGAMAALAK